MNPGRNGTRLAKRVLVGTDQLRCLGLDVTLLMLGPGPNRRSNEEQ